MFCCTSAFFSFFAQPCAKEASCITQGERQRSGADLVQAVGAEGWLVAGVPQAVLQDAAWPSCPCCSPQL